ncbi:MAG TPA: hypothetical protein VG847_13955 [Chitinophagaceae bacterium]|nr:hypothetical protein [Chitinophagaceae bacterium]
MNKKDLIILAVIAAGIIAGIIIKHFAGGFITGVFITVLISIPLGRWIVKRAKQKILASLAHSES